MGRRRPRCRPDRRAACTRGGEWVRPAPVRSGSSTRGKRSVRLDAHTTAELVRHRRRPLEERMAYGVGSRPELVFTRPDGGQLQPQRISRSFQSLARRAELPSIRLHDLRHTAATLRSRRRDPSQGGLGTARPLDDPADARHLQPRRRRHPRGGCRAAGRRVVRTNPALEG